MYPTLYHLFFDLFGVQWHWMKLLNSFGFFVALAFMVASVFLSMELKRKENEGLLQPEKRKIILGKPLSWSEVWINAAIGFLFGWKALYLFLNASEIFKPGELPQRHIFSWEGNLFYGLLFAAIFGGWRYYELQKSKRAKIEEKDVLFHKYQYTGNITMVAAFWGVVGSKLFHLFENPKEFMAFFSHPTLESFLSGLTIYGGLIVGGIAVWIFARRKKINFAHLTDAISPALILAYGLGRMGCHVSGDGDWGIANTSAKPSLISWLPDWMWSYAYPNNVNAVLGQFPGGYEGKYITPDMPYAIYEGYGTYLSPGVFPTPLYELLMTLFIFGVLWFGRKKIKTPGMLFSLYLMFNGVERFLIEKIRVNNVFDFLGMSVTQAEVISTLVFFSGLALFIYLWKYKRTKHDA